MSGAGAGGAAGYGEPCNKQNDGLREDAGN